MFIQTTSMTIWEWRLPESIHYYVSCSGFRAWYRILKVFVYQFKLTGLSRSWNFYVAIGTFESWVPLKFSFFYRMFCSIIYHQSSVAFFIYMYIALAKATHLERIFSKRTLLFLRNNAHKDRYRSIPRMRKSSMYKRNISGFYLDLFLKFQSLNWTLKI